MMYVCITELRFKFQIDTAFFVLYTIHRDHKQHGLQCNLQEQMITFMVAHEVLLFIIFFFKRIIISQVKCIDSHIDARMA